MAIVLDIIGSLAIRGAIVLVMLRLNVSLQQTLYLKTANANVRSNLATLVAIIETDFRQLGYGASTTPFLVSDSSNVKFIADFSNNGTIDSVYYYLTGTEVYRRYNSTNAVRIGRGVTQFKFEYYSFSGVQTAVLDDVVSVKLSVAMEEDYLITNSSDGQDYRPSATSVHQFFPQNL